MQHSSMYRYSNQHIHMTIYYYILLVNILAVVKSQRSALEHPTDRWYTYIALIKEENYIRTINLQ